MTEQTNDVTDLTAVDVVTLRPTDASQYAECNATALHGGTKPWHMTQFERECELLERVRRLEFIACRILERV